MRRLLWTRPNVSARGDRRSPGAGRRSGAEAPAAGMSGRVMTGRSTANSTRRSSGGMDPFGPPVGPVLFLPHRHDDLEPIDGVTAGLESLAAVRAGDGDGDADLADLEVPQPMHQGDFADRPALARLGL